jgi:ABC-type amino acid transport system permease subunit
MIDVLITYQDRWIEGLSVTLQLLGLVAVIGILLGTLLGVIGANYSSLARYIVSSGRFFTKVIPVLVLLFWFHYPLQALLRVVIDPFFTTVIVLALVNTLAVAYIIQNELLLLPSAYRDAGKTLGLSSLQIVRKIELPIIFRRVVPGLFLLQAAMLEYTLFASLISVPELFRVAQSINAMIYRPVEVYSLLVFFFILILAPLHLLSLYLKKKWNIIYA